LRIVIEAFALFLLQTVPLSFAFTFYGHEVKQITIATGGIYSLVKPISQHIRHATIRWTIGTR